ncbi:MAG: hypothetical protein ACR2MN_06785 [Acidimicrobiales bacterium]
MTLRVFVPRPAGWENMPNPSVAAVRLANRSGPTTPTVTALVEPIPLAHGTPAWDNWVSSSLRDTAERLPGGAVADFERSGTDSWGLIDFLGDRGPATVLQRFAPEHGGQAVLVGSAVVDKASWPDLAGTLRSLLSGTCLVEIPDAPDAKVPCE